MLNAYPNVIRTTPQPTAVVSNPLDKKKNKIFIVHGHDENSKSTLDEMLKEMGLEPIILHQISS